MRDFDRPQPIHPASCTCPRCNPRIIAGRRRTTLEIGLCALIAAAACLAAALAILGAN